MNRKIELPALALTLLGFGVFVPLLSACSLYGATPKSDAASVQKSVDQVVADNQAGAKANASIALLNIIRAARHETRYYVGYQTWSQNSPYYSSTLSAGILPLTGTASITGNSAQSGATVSAYTGSDFERGITTPVSVDTIIYFADQGFPVSVLLHLFVRKIDVYDKNGNLTHQYVNSPESEDEYQDFDALANDLSACTLKADPGEAEVPIDPNEIIGPGLSSKDVGNLEQQVNLASKGYMLVEVPGAANARGHGAHAQKATPKYLIIPKPEPELQFVQPTKAQLGNGTYKYCSAGRKKIYADLKQQNKKLTTANPAGPQGERAYPRMDMELRSPEATVFYLGQILKREQKGIWNPNTQSYNGAEAESVGAVRFIPAICSAEKKTSCNKRVPQCLPLFVVLWRSHGKLAGGWKTSEHGTCLLEADGTSQSVSVRAPEIDTSAAAATLASVTDGNSDYALPPYHGDNMDTALVFTLLQQVIALQAKTKNLPTTTYVHAIP